MGLVGNRRLVVEAEDVHAEPLVLAQPAQAGPAPELELVVDLKVLHLRVVEDREARAELANGIGRGSGPVVSRQGVGVAQEDRVPVGDLAEEIDVRPERAADLQHEVGEPVERGGDQPVGLHPAGDLALELGCFPEEGIEGRPVDGLERLLPRAEGDPGLVDVDPLVGAGGVSVVEIDEVDLDATADPPGQLQVEVDDGLAHLEGGAGGHGRQSHVVLSLRNEFRRERREDREAVALRPAVVHLQLGRDVQEDAIVGGIGLEIVFVLRPQGARREKGDRQHGDVQPSHVGCSLFRRVKRSTYSTRPLPSRSRWAAPSPRSDPHLA